MNNFEYYNPTKIVFGVGEFKKLGKETKQYGNTALLIKTVGPLEELGVFKKAHQYMESCDIKVYDLEGITSNPKLSKIEEGINFCKENNVDVVVAVGGGSAIDAAKAIGLGAVSEGDVWDYFEGKRQVEKTLPVIAVSTISATGAEMSCHCVVTNDRDEDSLKWKKWALHDPHVFPKTAILDAELLASVPPKLTAAGMADSISHVLEGYFDGVPDNPISDRIGEGIIMTILENDDVLENVNNLKARANLSWAATLAMNGLQDCGRSNAGFPAHWIQHAVGALTDSSHGEGLAVLNPAWLKHVNEENPDKFVQFTKRVFNLDRKDNMTDVEYGQAGLDELKRIFAKWGLPTNLSQLGVTEEMIPKIVEAVLNNNESYPFEGEVVTQVLKDCLY